MIGALILEFMQADYAGDVKKATSLARDIEDWFEFIGSPYPICWQQGYGTFPLPTGDEVLNLTAKYV